MTVTAACRCSRGLTVSNHLLASVCIDARLVLCNRRVQNCECVCKQDVLAGCQLRLKLARSCARRAP